MYSSAEEYREFCAKILTLNVIIPGRGAKHHPMTLICKGRKNHSGPHQTVLAWEGADEPHRGGSTEVKVQGSRQRR